MAKQHCLHGEEDCNRCAMNDIEAPTIHLHILLDVSVSMLSRWKQTISGLNEYIAALRNDQSPYKVSISTFGLEKEVTSLYSNEDLDNIAKFDEETLTPNGHGTALWAAVGITLQAIETSQPVLFLVITDGEENSSVTWDSERVEKLILECQKKGNYSFAYLGADKAAWDNTSKIKAFSVSSMNLQAKDYNIGTFTGLATLTSTYSGSMRSASRSGQAMSVNNFFAAETVTDEANSIPATATGGSGDSH